MWMNCSNAILGANLALNTEFISHDPLHQTYPSTVYLAHARSARAGRRGGKTAPKLKQFVYVLRPVPRLHDDQAWTDDDKKTVGVHFAHLKAATAEGKVVLAGRTLEPGNKTFGLVIFEAADEVAARTFMHSDPAIIGKIMTAELHPYAIALQRKP